LDIAATDNPPFALFLWSKGPGGKYTWGKVDCDKINDRTIHGVISSTQEMAAVFSEKNAGYYIESRDHHEELMRGILTAKWTPAMADVFRVNIFTYNDKSGLYEKGAYTVDRYKLAGKLGQLLRDAGDASRRTGICLGLLDVALWAYTYVSQSAGWMSGSIASPLCIPLMLLFGSMLYGFGLLLQYAYERRYGHTEAAV
jgi:hypothetical protein